MCQKAVGFHVELLPTDLFVIQLWYLFLTSYLDSEYILQRIQFEEHLLAKLERECREKIHPKLYMMKHIRGRAVNLGMTGNCRRRFCLVGPINLIELYTPQPQANETCPKSVMTRLVRRHARPLEAGGWCLDNIRSYMNFAQDFETYTPNC